MSYFVAFRGSYEDSIEVVNIEQGIKTIEDLEIQDREDGVYEPETYCIIDENGIVVHSGYASKVSKPQQKAKQTYRKKTKQIAIEFNIETEMELYSFLANKPNKTKYIKDLLRREMGVKSNE